MTALTTQQLLQGEGWQQQLHLCCGDSLKCVCIQQVTAHAVAQQSDGSCSCHLHAALLPDCLHGPTRWLDGLLLCFRWVACQLASQLATPTGMLVPSMGSDEASHTLQLPHTQAVQIGAAGLSGA